MQIEGVTVRPLFIKPDSLPSSVVGPASHEEICRAAERISGDKSILGLQRAGGLLRLYPYSEAARTRLAAEGFAVRGVRVFPTLVSPKRTFSFNGKEIPASRLVISNIPLSVSNFDILDEILRAGYKQLTPLSLDCLRDRAGKLTRFYNGNRSMFVVRPSDVLPKTVKIQDKFTGFLYYPEREEVERNLSQSLSLSPPPQAHSDATDATDNRPTDDTETDFIDDPINTPGVSDTVESVISQPPAEPLSFTQCSESSNLGVEEGDSIFLTQATPTPAGSDSVTNSPRKLSSERNDSGDRSRSRVKKSPLKKKTDASIATFFATAVSTQLPGSKPGSRASSLKRAADAASPSPSKRSQPRQ